MTQGDLVHARLLLKELEPKTGESDLRGFEWRASGIKHKAIRGRIFVVRAAENHRLVLAPDETMLAVHDASGTVTLYDTVTRREILRVQRSGNLPGFLPTACG